MIIARQPIILPTSLHGLGQDSTDPFTNLQASFSDLFSTLGPLEYGILIVGGYILFSTIFTTTRGVSAVRGYTAARAKKRKRRQELEQELAGL